ncbi:hypothetical protein GCM10012275_10610 [Longimycelium tulufanense]|uniref:Uncharacterized protein n=1 Tax=Longimycelium tulufanense TaxID=907463 RepID=A0A8J3FU87_9PSEU|nr:hypothetical protein GCM10012275_10610 [Longimycelium tulufanense]
MVTSFTLRAEEFWGLYGFCVASAPLPVEGQFGTWRLCPNLRLGHVEVAICGGALVNRTAPGTSSGNNGYELA